MPKLSLIIPCYNEAKNLPLLIERCQSTLANKDIEVILVDNGSKDESPRVLEMLLNNHPFIRSVRVEVNQGYGFGILTGLKAGLGDYLAWTHADMQTDPADILKGLAIIQSHHNQEVFIKGRRQGRPLPDVFFTAGMSLFETLLMGKCMIDINAQPTIFPRNFFNSWHNPPHDFSLDLYAYYQAKIQGLQVFRFPVLFAKRAHGHSHWNVNWQAKIKFIKRTLSYSFKLKKTLRDAGK